MMQANGPAPGEWFPLRRGPLTHTFYRVRLPFRTAGGWEFKRDEVVIESTNKWRVLVNFTDRHAYARAGLIKELAEGTMVVSGTCGCVWLTKEAMIACGCFEGEAPHETGDSATGVPPELSARDATILKWWGDGRTAPQIADLLRMELKTVNNIIVQLRKQHGPDTVRYHRKPAGRRVSPQTG